jgi:hypothetical protein
LRRSIPLAVAALAAAGVTTIATTASSSAATTSHAAGSSRSADVILPPHVYAPYFEAYDSTDGGLAQLSAESGAKDVSLAFLQTEAPGSCTAYWNGDTSTPISATAAGSFGADIAAIEARGGTVIPSFGGYTADTTNTELADSCTNVSAIAAVYESLVTTYHITRIDLDVEADSLTNTAGIERRNEAVAQTEAWAAANHKVVQFDYTIPVNPTGLTATGLSVLQNAAAEGAKITEVNIMTFDYYIGTTQDMLADSESAAVATHGQLESIYPNQSPLALWHSIGITVMPGIDDFGAAETFTTADAPALLAWAATHDLGLLSIWALQRDNGGCVGTKGAGSCSGVAQPTWYFSHVFGLYDYLP